MNLIKQNNEENLKVNLHILEPCNYRCKHCFAHFDNKKLLSVNQWKYIINNCINSININEFNIAGGEPLLYKDLIEIVKYINSINCKCSIITNGSLITDSWIKENAKYFSTIGFSIDSFQPETLIKMQRCTENKKYLTKERLKQICSLIKDINPKCKIKINTVVTSLNKNENIIEIIKEQNLPIDRYKIIKMRVFKTDNFDNSNISINNKDFDTFVNNNLSVLNIDPNYCFKNSSIYNTKNSNLKQIVIENTVEAGYIIIDANGYLIDNSKNNNHISLIDCTKDKFLDGFNKLSFNKELYYSRYKK